MVNRTEVVRFRLRKEEKEQLAEEAEKRKISVSALIRMVLRNYLNGAKK